QQQPGACPALPDHFPAGSVRAMKSLSKSSQIPLYQQVVEWIRESIYTGDLVEDDRIPSEYQIMDMLEVSRGTVKKAVAQLVKEGVLIQVQGKGTFVKKENVAYP
ncbi:GntR family transcriptional regulator, partial [Pseudomonas aeruginosa]|uniref:GntR family transcriptional regulator n=1 Tax=Pseudomonas aeruginosa TaxID=287 RepID=UPI0031B6746B